MKKLVGAVAVTLLGIPVVAVIHGVGWLSQDAAAAAILTCLVGALYAAIVIGMVELEKKG